MTKYVLSEDVEIDLDTIWEYVAADSIDAADRLVDALFDAFELIAKSPRIGHSRTDLTKLKILFWTVGAYVILYRTVADTVEVVAVTQGSRDVPRFLNQRLS